MSDNVIIPFVLSGGTGMRVWPVSRISNPKQMVSMYGRKSMFQNTLIRLNRIKSVGNPLIVCNSIHEKIIIRELRNIGEKEYSLIIEPIPKSTAPAIAVAILRCLTIGENDPICLVVPSDHEIKNIDGFDEVLRDGFLYAKQGYLVILGIPPTRPETGFGYIKKGPKVDKIDGFSRVRVGFFVDEFVEKPKREVAEKYLTSGLFFWNSGIFMFRASRMLKELKHFSPDIVRLCELAVSEGTARSKVFYLEKRFFSRCPEVSIDLAIMEKARNCIMMPMDVGWNDLGSWESIWLSSKKDSKSNVIKGDVVSYDVESSYIRSESRLVAAVGMKEHFLVETADAVLVAPLNRSQDIKYIVQKLSAKGRKEVFSEAKKCFYWGSSEILFTSDILIINHVIVKPGESFCVDEYFGIDGSWLLINGVATYKNQQTEFHLDKSKFFNIEKKCFFFNIEQDEGFLELIEMRGAIFSQNKQHSFWVKDKY